jgi:hypothetical protein
MPIAPDTKDWTWVLERRCPECGFDASSFPREQVSDMLRATAREWQAVLARSNVAERPSDDLWSPLEYACHVRDVFRVYDERLVLMLTRDAPLYPNWDQDRTAVEDRYREQDPVQVAAEMIAAASKLADRFAAVDGEAWARAGTRSDGAHFTVETLARYMIHDPIHHLHDVA